MVVFYTVTDRFLYFCRIAGALTPYQSGMYLCRLISRAFKIGISQTEESEFAFLLTNYIKQTLTFREWQRNAEGNQRLHFLINIYGAKEDGGEVVLRPFIVNPDELMLTPADVVEFNSQVIKVDRQRHPEWFR
ncbi:TPA: hypothetical protein ACGBFF_004835 [Escherichia coli]